VQDLALLLQVLDRPRDVLDGNLRIDPVLVEEVDAVGAEALEHSFDGELDVLGLAVEPRAPLACLEVDVPAEFGRDHDLVSEGRDTLAENALDLVRAVLAPVITTTLPEMLLASVCPFISTLLRRDGPYTSGIGLP
jgi:hypothetical protein